MNPGANRGRWTASPLRRHFLLVLAISLTMGILLYAVPSLGQTAWPYRLKPLATRFFASVFLAVAVGSLVALREPRRAAADVLLVMGASVFGIIGLAVAVDAGAFTLGAAGLALWFFLFGGLALASVAFLVRGRGAPRVEGPPVPRLLRTHFLLHTVVVLFFALQMLLVPAFAKTWWPWAVTDWIMRAVGGLFTGVAIGTAWSYRQRSWDRVRLLLPVNVTFVSLVLLAVGLQWDVILAESPGWYVTGPWLLLYEYTGLYPVYHLLRPPKPQPPSDAASSAL